MRLFDFLQAAGRTEPRPPTTTQLVGPRVVLRSGVPSDYPQWQTLRGLSCDFLKPWEPKWPPDGLSRPFYEGMCYRHIREWRQGQAYAFLIFLHKKPNKEPSFRGPVTRSLPRELPFQLDQRVIGNPETSYNFRGTDQADGVTGSRINFLFPRKLGKRKFSGMTPAGAERGEQGARDKILIGGIGLNDLRRGIGQKATLGYWIGQPYAQQGYMTEAAGMVCDFGFRTLKLHRIEASCLPHNESSKKLLQRLGFTEEGYAKSYLRIDGEWQDHVLWGKTRA